MKSLFLKVKKEIVAENANVKILVTDKSLSKTSSIRQLSTSEDHKIYEDMKKEFETEKKLDDKNKVQQGKK